MAKLTDCHSIEDLRRLGRKKIPKVMFDYIDRGAEDEITLERNRQSFQSWQFVPRILRDVSEIDLSATVQGVDLALPVLSAPTGMSRMFHHQGERAVVKASHAHGTAYCLSTVSTVSIEDVRKASPGGPLFFQVYAWRNHDIIDDFLKRSRAAGYAGIMLAVDMPVLGKREQDLRNGHGTPKLKRNTALMALSKPGWLFRFATSKPWVMANLTGHLPHGAKAVKVIQDVNNQFDPKITWDHAKSIQDKWQGKFLLKGIQSVEDAVRAADMGASGIVLSNHGGRQLDGAPAAMDILPDVVDAVDGRLEVLIDGGIRRGSDIIKAVALGATGCLIGKAYLYGLAAGGQVGVERAYEILTAEMKRVMQLIGCRSIKELDRSYVQKAAW